MRKKILILDDDEDIRALLEFILHRAGFETMSSGDPDMLNKAINAGVNLILMDNRLGNGYGKDFCRRLKENPVTQYLPVILVSGNANPEQLQIECKADAFLVKPFDIDNLLKMIEKFI